MITRLSLPSLEHFRALVGPYGLYQHARYESPRLEEGYCTDDNVRAVQTLVEMREVADTNVIRHTENLLDCCWKFTCEAQTSNGKFRNFRSSTGTWLDDQGSEDTQARAARCLATVIARDTDLARRTQAMRMLEKLLPSLNRLEQPRGLAESIIALTIIRSTKLPAIADAVIKRATRKLLTTWSKYATGSWPWFEGQLTYANALLPHGLLLGAMWLNTSSEKLARVIASSARFLIASTVEESMFSPVGNRTWYSQTKQKATYDQQPIEAHTMFDFLITYSRQTDERMAPEIVAAPYLWFYGHNTRQASLVQLHSGACCDGLTEVGTNKNQGAESLLAYLRNELLIRQADLPVKNYAGSQQADLILQKAAIESPT